MKAACPICKGKEIIPIVYGEKSRIIRKGLEEGQYFDGDLLEEHYPRIHCKDCGYNWFPGDLSSLFITKLRWKCEEVLEGRLLGTHILEIFPDGKCTYKEYHGKSRKTCQILKGKIGENNTSFIFNWVDRNRKESVGICDNAQFSATSASSILQVSFADGYKRWFPDDEAGTVWDLAMEVLDEDGEIRKAFSEPFSLQQAEEADKDLPKPVEIDRKSVDRGLFLMKTRKTDGRGRVTEDGGFVVLAGSRIADTETRSCSKTTHEIRRKYIESGAVIDFVTQKDLYFKGPSPACAFVTGGLGDGNLWKNGLGKGIHLSPSEEILEQLRDLYVEMTEEEISTAHGIGDEMIQNPHLYPSSFFEERTSTELTEVFREKKIGAVTDKVRQYWILFATEQEMWEELLKDLEQMEKELRGD